MNLMGLDIVDIIKKYLNSEILPQLAAINESLKHLEKDLDNINLDIKNLYEKYNELNAKFSKLEGSTEGLEDKLKAQIQAWLVSSGVKKIK
jgi:predicted nuclease with TOPRIM domain